MNLIDNQKTIVLLIDNIQSYSVHLSFFLNLYLFYYINKIISDLYTNFFKKNKNLESKIYHILLF